MNKMPPWIIISVAILLVACGGLGYKLGHTAGYTAHADVSKQETINAIKALEGNKLIPIVRCSKDLPAGTVLTMSDMVVEKTQTASCPADSIESRLIGVGRRLRYAKAKGEDLVLIDLGLK